MYASMFIAKVYFLLSRLFSSETRASSTKSESKVIEKVTFVIQAYVCAWTLTKVANRAIYAFLWKCAIDKLKFKTD